MIVYGLALCVIGNYIVRTLSKRCYKVGTLIAAMGASMVMIALGISLSDVQLWFGQINTYSRG